MGKEKKEIGKLIELLNEYVEKHNKSDLYYKFELENGELYCYDDVTDVLWTMQDEAMVICSKQFGFINWLVDNDKIELDAGPLYGCQLIMYNRQPYTLCETILMLLAIEENPISLLISILK